MSEAIKMRISGRSSIDVALSGGTPTNMFPGFDPNAISRLEQKFNELMSNAEVELQRYVDECEEIKESIDTDVEGLVEDVSVTVGNVSIKPFNTATLRKGDDNEYSVLELGTNVQLSFIVNGSETEEASFVTDVSVTRKHS